MAQTRFPIRLTLASDKWNKQALAFPGRQSGNLAGAEAGCVCDVMGEGCCWGVG